MKNRTYEPCPVCSRKGWYLVPYTQDSGLRYYDLHACEYCWSHDSIDFRQTPPKKYLAPNKENGLVCRCRKDRHGDAVKVDQLCEAHAQKVCVLGEVAVK